MSRGSDAFGSHYVTRTEPSWMELVSTRKSPREYPCSQMTVCEAEGRHQSLVLVLECPVSASFFVYNLPGLRYFTISNFSGLRDDWRDPSQHLTQYVLCHQQRWEMRDQGKWWGAHFHQHVDTGGEKARGSAAWVVERQPNALYLEVASV